MDRDKIAIIGRGYGRDGKYLAELLSHYKEIVDHAKIVNELIQKFKPTVLPLTVFKEVKSGRELRRERRAGQRKNRK
jgi:Xaa-Pro aminopeptidase